MYKKFKISLFSPSHIIELINDKWKAMWVYFFSMVLFLMIPMIIVNSTEKGMTIFQYRGLSNLVKNESVIEAKIENGKLVTEKEFSGSFDQYSLYITNNDVKIDLSSMHVIVLSDEKVSYFFRQMEVTSSTYSEIGLDSYDFSDRTATNQVIFVDAINHFFIQHKASIITVSLLVDFVGIALEMILIIAVISLFNMKQVPFKYKFKINVYAATVYTLFNFFAVLFQTQEVAYLGIFLMFIYSSKAFSRVISIR